SRSRFFPGFCCSLSILNCTSSTRFFSSKCRSCCWLLPFITRWCVKQQRRARAKVAVSWSRVFHSRCGRWCPAAGSSSGSSADAQLAAKLGFLFLHTGFGLRLSDPLGPAHRGAHFFGRPRRRNGSTFARAWATELFGIRRRERTPRPEAIRFYRRSGV